MNQDRNRLLFYLNTLYEFAEEISGAKPADEILRRMLRIVVGIGITKGMVLVRHADTPTFELVTYEHLTRRTVENLSGQLDAGISENLGELSGFIELSTTSQAPSIPPSLLQAMQDAGMVAIVVCRVRDQLTACIGLGPLLSAEPFAEHQIELISALAKHTEVALGNALFYQDILQENQYLRTTLHKQYQFDNMVGQSPQMQAVYRRIQQVATYPNYSVLICGESGTGKELIAGAIHRHSPRKDQQYLAINCAALPQELVESELFGHEKGAFTGATQSKPGLFEVADGGTLFLDEIGEMPATTQAKLLRVLEQKEVMRIGGRAVQRVDTRVVAATNRDLETAMADGDFRVDLFHRFDVAIHTVPLRDRKEDIPLLVNRLMEEIAEENQQQTKTVSAEALKVLMNYHWPGNVRELRKVLMEAIMITKDDVIPSQGIPLPLDPVQTLAESGLSLKGSTERLKYAMIEDALNRHNGNRTKAAAQLGITRQNLQNMMRRLSIK